MVAGERERKSRLRRGAVSGAPEARCGGLTQWVRPVVARRGDGVGSPLLRRVRPEPEHPHQRGRVERNGGRWRRFDRPLRNTRCRRWA